MTTGKTILCTLIVLIILCWPTGVCGFDLNQDPWYYQAEPVKDCKQLQVLYV